MIHHPFHENIGLPLGVLDGNGFLFGNLLIRKGRVVIFECMLGISHIVLNVLEFLFEDAHRVVHDGIGDGILTTTNDSSRGIGVRQELLLQPKSGSHRFFESQATVGELLLCCIRSSYLCLNSLIPLLDTNRQLEQRGEAFMLEHEIQVIACRGLSVAGRRHFSFQGVMLDERACYLFVSFRLFLFSASNKIVISFDLMEETVCALFQREGEEKKKKYRASPTRDQVSFLQKCMQSGKVNCSLV